MSNSKQIKEIRGQVRQVVQEQLPAVLSAELQSALYKQIAGELTAKLQVIDQELKRQLKEIDDRAKDVQSFLMREVVNNSKAKPAEEIPISE